MDSPRIQELRRRVDRDPSSIAFAQLAEEYRRAGNYDQAVRVCRSGLAQHPTYLSARVTLGRALLELNQLDEAQTEFEGVIHAAPDHLAAVRALAEIHQRRGDLDEGRKPLSTTHALGRDAVPSWSPDFTGAPEALDSLSPDLRLSALPAAARPEAGDPAPQDPALDELEWWLEAIVADRQARARAGARG